MTLFFELLALASAVAVLAIVVWPRKDKREDLSHWTPRDRDGR